MRPAGTTPRRGTRLSSSWRNVCLISSSISGENEAVCTPDACAACPKAAVKRLAIQGHDHERELLFFKGEVTARRGVEDTWTDARFWAGLMYEGLSDFGRSVVRPLFWLVLSVVAFSGIYVWQSEVAGEQAILSRVACVAGPGEVRSMALSLSLHKAFPFAGIGSSGKLERMYACLYGINDDVQSGHESLPRFFHR